MAKEPKDGPPGWVWDGDSWNPPSIGPVPSSKGKGDGGAKKSPIERNRKSLTGDDPMVQKMMDTLGMSEQEARAFLASDGSAASGGDPLEEALTQAALEVSGIDLFTYGEQRLPHWVPKSLRKYATPSPGMQSKLYGTYDPYYGFLDNQGDDRVYMGAEDHEKWVKNKKQHNDPALSGKEAKLYGDSYTEQHKVTKKRDKVMSYQQAQNLPYTWDDDKVADAMKKMRQAGMNVTSFDQLTQAWGALVDRASKMYTMSQGGRKVTPWDVLELQKREQKAAGSLVDYESGSQTRTATSVADISEGASWQVLQRTLSSLLGRDPSDQEVRDYAYRMNTLAAKNPSITETVTRYKAGEAVSSESHTTGGFDAGDMAQAAYDQAQDDPEYAKVQGGTTYFNALMSAIGAVGNV